MYSFAPKPDLSDSHFGFYVLVSICLIVFVYIMWLMQDEIKAKVVIILLAILSIPVGIAGVESYTPHHPLNQEVVGTFVSYLPEGYISSSGKYRSEHHYLYVIYSVEGSQAVFRANEGTVYPPRAKIYKN